MNRIFFLSVVFVSCLSTVGKVSLAQKANNPKQDERNENERVAKANRIVADAKKDLAQSLQELRTELASQGKAAISLQQLRKKLRETREDAEDRLGAKVGIPETLAKARQAGASLELIADKVRAQVHETSQWMQANQVSEEAKKKKAAIAEDIEQSGNDADLLLAELAKQIRKPLDLENEAIAKDASAIEAIKQLAKQQSDLDEKRKLLPKGEVDRDPKVVQVLKELERQEKSVAEIELKIRKSKWEASKIQKRYADAVSSLQKAKAADAADPNRVKRNNGKPT